MAARMVAQSELKLVALLGEMRAVSWGAMMVVWMDHTMVVVTAAETAGMMAEKSVVSWVARTAA